MTYISNSDFLPDFNSDRSNKDLPNPNHNPLSNNDLVTSNDDWSGATQELLDTLPHIWTRGLLYFLVAFVAIILPWAMLYKIDETGTARGRLELKGDTVKREADIPGAIAVMAVYVKEGDNVKAGQVLMELDSKSVRDELQQQGTKLEGQQNRLAQLNVLKNQLILAINSQQQQNKAQELEKLTQVEQARQNLNSVNTSYHLQKVEKLAPIDQAKQAILDSQTVYRLADSRLIDAQIEEERYQNLFSEGAVPYIKVKEMEAMKKENLRLLNQSESDIIQAELRLQEQQRRYESIIHQAESDIQQAALRLQEQKRSYQSLLEAGKLAISKSKQQVNELNSQITSLQSEIDQAKSQIKSLNEQLAKYVIHAPFDGTIFQLPIKREGAVVQPKELIAEIAPKGTRLVFKGQIPTSESESIRSGKEQKEVKLKFDEYPFQDYGVVQGKLSRVSPDSKITQTAQGNLTTYDLEVELTQNCIQPESKCISFKSGQPATAEVIIRQRRIIDLLIDPFKKLQQGDLKL
ncbi:HlyD family efflux transporter periplasmic adaptor subunit [Nostoc sp. C052]|uniref:HlyD family efflux transporter periplasmic adaptor subunit n=1 Tax=Nostoc sp. C052 TaxID=2576902 RepID=UPI0015C3B0CE|nr:HlyD family efflux transporter periplasmic adaptor subunit [Nostoc sp. C052]QLE39985.1 HlyD family efflux transporter periplasmic adaptor subunit [Nostoc sp. C052]